MADEPTCIHVLGWVRLLWEKLYASHNRLSYMCVVVCLVSYGVVGCEDPLPRKSKPTSGLGLHNAVVRGDEPLVRRLIEQGEDINELDSHGRATPLGVAASCAKMRIAQLLIKYGADVNKACPLYYAATKGDLDMIKLLLKSGADPRRYRLRQVPSCFMATAFDGHVEALKALVAEAGMSKEEGVILLFETAVYGNDNMVRYLLTQGVSADAIDSDGDPVLYRAAEANRLKVVEVLLESGADVGRRTKAGVTALDIAQNKGHTGIVEAIEKAKSDK